MVEEREEGGGRCGRKVHATLLYVYGYVVCIYTGYVSFSLSLFFGDVFIVELERCMVGRGG